MDRTVLVINSGSSSIKYQLVDTDTEQALAVGLIERIGEASADISHKGPAGEATWSGPIADHEAGMRAMLAQFASHGPDLGAADLAAVGHRVVQGGDRFSAATVITAEVEAAIEECATLAPLHNPANLQGIRAARQAFPNIPHVAVFDTAFHRTLPPAAYTYAIDPELAATYGVRRYGMHGTSHHYVSQQAAEFLGKDPAELNIIVAHLGNGASITAVRGGKSVETSMGLTPLEGLVMGTRSGDLDPAILIHLHRQAGLSFDELDVLLNRRSGLLGMAGSNDLRDVQKAAAGGDERAQLAIDVYAHRIRHYVGAYLAQLGHLDAIVFTAGVGENDAAMRAAALAGLEPLGIEVDAERNASRVKPARISPDGASVAVLVIATNEELQIARESLEVAFG